MIKKTLIGLFLVTTGILTASVISYAWTEPSGMPPNGNVGSLSSTLQSGNLVIDGVVHTKDFIIDFFLPGNSATSTLSLSRYINKDGDAYTPAQGDCNDSDPAIYPGATPQYNSGKDADCNGVAEYTVDVTQSVNTWNIDSACTKGGHAVNDIGYITDSAGWTKLANHAVTTNTNGYINNLNLIRGFDWGNKYTKRLICLGDNGRNIWIFYHIYIGNSGNSGSCGGHGEMDYDYYTNDPGQRGFWHIWCN